jgi:starch-binding outer membrane protein, SusD/RagB family
MKNKAKIFVMSGLLLGIATACGDQFFDKKPFGSVNESLLSANSKGADALLIAAYSELDGYGGWNGNPWGAGVSNWTYGSIAGGDAYKGSEANDQPIITPIERHESDAINEYLDGKWRLVYDGVSRANRALVALKNLKDANADFIKLRTAEARFLRGYYHLEAKKMWKNIPYIDETLTEFRVGNTVDAWPRINEDFAFAVANLPLTQAEVGRATKGAAQGLYGKALMYQGKYAEAKAQFDGVISSGKYKLAAGFHDNFNADTKNNSESVFAVQQSVNDGTEGDNGNVGDVLAFTHNGGPGGCCGFHQPSQDLANSYRVDKDGLPFLETFYTPGAKGNLGSDQGLAIDAKYTPPTDDLDPRIDWTLGRRGIPYLDWGNHPGVGWVRDQAYGGPYSPKKTAYYKAREGVTSSASGWTKGYTANNFNIIRYADLILMAAEAEIETGNIDKARTYVNEVRKRAAIPKTFVTTPDGKPAANYKIGTYDAPWTNAETARTAVRYERRLELATEGHRFFDLVRWGVAEKVKNAYFANESKVRSYLNGASFKTGQDEYYPIPKKALTLSAKEGKETLIQNPGY